MAFSCSRGSRAEGISNFCLAATSVMADFLAVHPETLLAIEASRNEARALRWRRYFSIRWRFFTGLRRPGSLCSSEQRSGGAAHGRGAPRTNRSAAIAFALSTCHFEAVRNLFA